MRKLATLLLVVLILPLVACTNPAQETPTPTVETPNVFVKDSAWDTVAEACVIKGAKALTTDADIIAGVEAYNASHADDLRRIYYDSAPAINVAPTATLYLAARLDNSPIDSITVPRSMLDSTRDAWRIRAASLDAVLYVEHDPPPYHFVLPSSPPATPTTDPYYKYAVYAVFTRDGAIHWEVHFETLADANFYREMLSCGDFMRWNSDHPYDQLAWVYFQRYEMPAGVEKR